MKRLIAAFVNSLAGLRYGFGNETAIRQELLLILASVAVIPAITFDPWRMLLLFSSILVATKTVMRTPIVDNNMGDTLAALIS